MVEQLQDLLLQHKVCYARILDSKRKFLDVRRRHAQKHFEKIKAEHRADRVAFATEAGIARDAAVSGVVSGGAATASGSALARGPRPRGLGGSPKSPRPSSGTPASFSL